MMTLLKHMFFVVSFLACAAPALPCDLPLTDAKDPSLEGLVRRARVIVRAKVDGLGDAMPKPASVPLSTVRFKVISRLKGTVKGEYIEFNGALIERDDDDGTPPFKPGDQPRSFDDCYAPEFVDGSEYLLLLGPDNGLLSDKGDLTPYWQPARATSERLSGEDDDPWLAFVTRAVRGRR